MASNSTPIQITGTPGESSAIHGIKRQVVDVSTKANLPLSLSLSLSLPLPPSPLSHVSKMDYRASHKPQSHITKSIIGLVMIYMALWFQS